MESIGEYLKREREIRGISLQDVAKTTKIRVGLLNALEKDDFSKLPAPPFVKGFIQAYCKHLGVDGHDALLRYEVYMKSLTESKVEPVEAAKAKDEKLERLTTLSTQSLIAIAVTILLIISAGAYVILKKHKPDAPDYSQIQLTTGNNVSDSNKKEAIAYEARSKQEDDRGILVSPSALQKGDKNKKESVSSKADLKGPMALIIQATKATWIRAEVDSQDPFEVSLREGEKVKWIAKEKFSILIGNAGGVNVTLNGNPLGRLGDEGKVVKLVLPNVTEETKEIPQILD